MSPPPPSSLANESAEDEPVRPAGAAQRLGVITIVAAALLFGLWAWMAPLHGAVVAMGLVKSASNRKVVQHTDGGVVKRILVRDGDSVREGQVLLELNDVRVDANQALLLKMEALESVKHARLDAEQQLAPSFALTRAQRGAGGQEVEEAFQRELKIFRTRRALLDEQIASFQRQMLSIQAEQEALGAQMQASLKAAKLARDELGLNESLVRDKFVSQSRLIALERTVAEYDAKKGEHEAMLAQSEQRKNDANLRMVSARSEYQRIAAEEFKESNGQLVQLREQLRPAQDAARRQAVVAPASGKVVGLRLNSPGEVALPRETLMEIVPDNEELLVEARVALDVIKDLQPGQVTELRFTTFNSRTTPLVKGELSYVSADAMPNKDGVPSYVIQVRARPEALQRAGIPALRPGMSAEVFVLLESRSTIDYLLTPITDAIRRSFRER